MVVVCLLEDKPIPAFETFEYRSTLPTRLEGTTTTRKDPAFEAFEQGRFQKGREKERPKKKRKKKHNRTKQSDTKLEKFTLKKSRKQRI
eukprot:scaffold5157_cov100-Cylindrotheca_fusiformis.AAC.4